MIFTIVLARLENTGTRKTGKLIRPDGVNWREELEVIPEPKALVWLNQGNEMDLNRARDHANHEGYSVFTFPMTEKDPIGMGKKKIMEIAK